MYHTVRNTNTSYSKGTTDKTWQHVFVFLNICGWKQPDLISRCLRPWFDLAALCHEVKDRDKIVETICREDWMRGGHQEARSYSYIYNVVSWFTQAHVLLSVLMIAYLACELKCRLVKLMLSAVVGSVSIIRDISMMVFISIIFFYCYLFSLSIRFLLHVDHNI